MTLQDRLLVAHACGDSRALVTLYTEAADQAADTDASCFFLTHAYVFALDVGDDATDALYRRLRALGRA